MLERYFITPLDSRCLPSSRGLSISLLLKQAFIVMVDAGTFVSSLSSIGTSIQNGLRLLEDCTDYVHQLRTFLDQPGFNLCRSGLFLVLPFRITTP